MLKKLLFLDGEEVEADRKTILETADKGFDDEDPKIRYFLWNVLLNLFPNVPEKWKTVLKTYNTNYEKCVEVYMCECKDWINKKFSKEKVISVFGLKYDKIMFSIHGDVARMSTSSFFEFQLVEEKSEIEIISRRIERILYIYTILNLDYGYTQGMHELVFPLYSISMRAMKMMNFDDDTIEASTFFFFHSLLKLSCLDSVFLMDNDIECVMKLFNKVKDIMKIADNEVYETMFIKNDILPLHFAFSWVSVMFSDVYKPGDLILLWDKLLIHIDNFMNYIMSMVVAHVLAVRDRIIGSDFATIINLLNHIEPFDVREITKKTDEILSQYEKAMKSSQ